MGTSLPLPNCIKTLCCCGCVTEYSHPSSAFKRTMKLLAMMTSERGKALKKAWQAFGGKNFLSWLFQSTDNQLKLPIAREKLLALTHRRSCGNRRHGWLITTSLVRLQRDIGVAESRGILQGCSDL